MKVTLLYSDFNRSVYSYLICWQKKYENIRSIRLDYWLPSKHLQKVLGAEVKTTILRGTPLSFNLINFNDSEND